MTVTYLTSPRGHTAESAVAVHLADGMARATECGLTTRNRMTTGTLERVTCRTCRAKIAEVE